jgi:hypothetical protein
MVTQSEASYAINISLHVFILFTFLTVFFFAFISKLSKKSINDALGGIIDKQVGNLLTNVDTWDKKIAPKTYPNIKWAEVNKLATKIEANAQGELPEIVANNKKLKIIGWMMIGGLLLLLIGMYVYFRFVKKYDVNIGHIFAGNAIIFAFIGIIEFLFFTKIASKYIPVTPDFVATTLLERIKYHVSHTVLDK